MHTLANCSGSPPPEDIVIINSTSSQLTYTVKSLLATPPRSDQPSSLERPTPLPPAELTLKQCRFFWQAPYHFIKG